MAFNCLIYYTYLSFSVSVCFVDDFGGYFCLISDLWKNTDCLVWITLYFIRFSLWPSIQLVFIHIAYTLESNKWGAVFFGSNLLFVFFPIMYITGGETFSVKDQVVNSSNLAGHAVSVSAANGDCVPVRQKCSKQVAVKIGTLSMSLPVFCLLHLLASDRMDQNFPCLLWIYSLYSQYVSEKLCLSLYLAIVPPRDFICVPAVFCHNNAV